MADPLPMLQMFDKQLTVRMGQAQRQALGRRLLPLVVDDADPLGVDDLATHQLPLEQAPEAYEMFQKKKDGDDQGRLPPLTAPARRQDRTAQEGDAPMQADRGPDGGTGRPLALVTGASSGIGRELARVFVDNGYDVLVSAEDDELYAAESSLQSSASTGTSPGTSRSRTTCD